MTKPEIDSITLEIINECISNTWDMGTNEKALRFFWGQINGLMDSRNEMVRKVQGEDMKE